MLGALNVSFHRQMAIWSAVFGWQRRAIEHWRVVARLRPADPRVPASIAHLLVAIGDREQAAQQLEHALTLDARAAATWFNLGYVQQELDRHEQAVASFSQAITLDEKLDRALYGKALSLIKLGRVDEAIPLLKRNTELQPMSPFGWYQLAHAYCRTGQPERAARVIQRLSTFEPQVARQLERETGLQGKAPQTPA